MTSIYAIIGSIAFILGICSLFIFILMVPEYSIRKLSKFLLFCFSLAMFTIFVINMNLDYDEHNLNYNVQKLKTYHGCMYYKLNTLKKRPDKGKLEVFCKKASELQENK